MSHRSVCLPTKFKKKETLSRNSRKQETPSRNRGFGVFWGGDAFPDDEDVESDDDAAFDWLVNVSNEISERIDVSLDQFKKLFGGLGAEGVQEVNVVANGSGRWFKREALGLDFVDRPDSAVEPVKPLPIEVTPFKLVEDLKGLKQLAIKLRNVDELRTEDFIIDTLRLRVQIGPHLREVFKDPTKRKVLHGADRDIVWLQRDFGIYVCNMFDTQASRVLKMERHSLEYLLNHFCGVVANKNIRMQIGELDHFPGDDQRLCHLFDPKLSRYAREDTHYLLYIYDFMRAKLLASAMDAESADPPLVYKRSYDICTQLYEKELLTDTSYLYIYGLKCAELNAQQLAVVSQLINGLYGLCEWRDAVARAEDESTGYVLPNRTLIEIDASHHEPTASGFEIQAPIYDRNLGSVVSIIRHSIQNAAAFEGAAKHLKERRLEMANEENTLAAGESEELPSEAPEILKNADEADNIPNGSLLNDPSVQKTPASIQSRDTGSSNAGAATDISKISCLSPKEKVNEKGKIGDWTSNVQNAPLHMDGDPDAHTKLNSSHSAEATVQILKKPSRAFGSLLGVSAKRKFDPLERSVSFCDSYPYVRYLCVCTSLEGIENGKAQHRIPVESFLWSRGKQRRLCHLFDPKLKMGKTYEVLRLQLPVINFPSDIPPFSMGLIAQATVASSSYIDRLSLDDDVPWRKAIWLRFRVLISMLSSCSCFRTRWGPELCALAMAQTRDSWLGELWWSRFDEIVSVADPLSFAWASGILAEMRSTYGANDCRLLCINSSSDGAEEHRRIHGHLIISNNKQYRYFLNADDVEEVGSRIHDFSAKHIIPLMELKIGVLNQQVYFVLEVV
ncbi:UNVERIFIED_CONTAM: protein RRP6-like 2, partial [Sesamum calycinum]